jgi:hypothetical protein
LHLGCAYKHQHENQKLAGSQHRADALQDD